MTYSLETSEAEALLPDHYPDAGEKVERPEYLQERDMSALLRFQETSDDDQSYDIGKDTARRLAEIGVLQSHGFGRYSITMFGHYVIESAFSQRPSLPLKTNSDRDAEHRDSIRAAAEIGRSMK